MVETAMLKRILMKHFLFVFGLMMTAVWILNAQPRLELSKSEIDLGTIYSGIPVKGRIEYGNSGNDTLRVNFHPTCGCTTIKPPKPFLLPKESDFVEFEFNSTGYNGKVDKWISIDSNDPRALNVGVQFAATVVSDLAPAGNRSSAWWTTNLPIGQTISDTRKFVNTSGHALTIKGVTTSSPSALQAVVEQRKIKPSESVAITITVKGEKIGIMREHVFVQTDSKEQPQVDIPIFCLVIQDGKK
jgi:hypothetical protein